MKKMLALLSVLCMMGAMTACGDDSSTTDSSSKKDDSSSAASTTTTAETPATTTTTTEAPKLEVDPNAITFDTASLYTAHCMAEKNFENDESNCNLDVVDLDGDKKLRVQVLDKDGDNYKVPKLVFNLPEILGLENVGNIGHISIDFTCVARETWKNEDGSESLVVGNFIGAIAGNIASEKKKDAEGNLVQNDWANHMEFNFNDWENPTQTWRAETDIPALLPQNGYAANDEACTLVIMRWGQANQVDFYLDNITFYDKDGNSMPIVYDAAANAVEVKEDTAKVDAPTGGDSSAADETTTSAAETTTTAAN